MATRIGQPKKSKTGIEDIHVAADHEPAVNIRASGRGRTSFGSELETIAHGRRDIGDDGSAPEAGIDPAFNREAAVLNTNIKLPLARNNRLGGDAVAVIC